MSIRFRPMPWLTALVLICLVILISLGTWQYQRLQWKTNLIAEIDMAAAAPAFTELNDIQKAFKTGEPIDFRRVLLSGEFIAPSVVNEDGFSLMMSSGKDMFWRLYQPFVSGDEAVLVATKTYSDSGDGVAPNGFSGPTYLAGYVRLVRPSSRFVPDSRPQDNKWFAFNAEPSVINWQNAVRGQDTQTAYYIDYVQDIDDASELPVRKPELRNHHLDYMLTWYSFAIILLVIYFILHRRAGRLSFGHDRG